MAKVAQRLPEGGSGLNSLGGNIQHVLYFPSASAETVNQGPNTPITMTHTFKDRVTPQRQFFNC